jgi:hypothetical protein
MVLDRVELFVRWAEAAAREDLVQKALRSLPGVASVGPLTQDAGTVEGRIEVEFDPRRTNPILFEDELAHCGVTVLSATERP